MKQWILILCVCLPLQTAAKHSKEYNDVMKQLSGMPNDTFKVQMLLNLADTYIKERHSRSDRMIYAQQALALADSIHYKKGTGDACNTIGRLTGYKHLAAVISFDKALQIRTELNDTTGMGRTLYYTSRVYIYHHNYEAAYTDLTKAKTLLEHADNKPMLAYATADLGWVDGRRNDHLQAKLNMGNAIAMFQQLGNKRAEGQTYVHLAYVCKRDGSYADAVKHAKKGKELALEVKDKKTVMRANHCLKHMPKQYRQAA